MHTAAAEPAVAAMAIAAIPLACAVLAALGSVLYLLILEMAAQAALSRRRRGAYRPRPRAAAPRMCVVMPAHNEEAVIAESLQALMAQKYPAHRRDVVVVADNCTDATAAIAREMGAYVLERRDLERRGKGQALAWAFDRLLAGDVGTPPLADAFAIVDADTRAHPQFLRRMAAALFPAGRRSGGGSLASERDARGRRLAAVQGRYSVRNPNDGWRAALTAGAFDLFNHVKPLGRDFLGATVGLKGNGMGFTRALIESVPHTASSITEDIEYGLDLLARAGVRVRYAPDARVWSAMPATAEASKSQRERWERGRFRLARERALPLLRAGLRRHDMRLVEAALDLLAPPLAELVGLHVLLGAAVGIAWLTRAPLPGGAPLWAALVGASFLGLAVYVLGGLRLARTPAAAYAALLRAPLYAAWKLSLYAAALAGRGTAGRGRRSGGDSGDGGGEGSGLEWVRTERVPAPARAEREPAL